MTTSNEKKAPNETEAPKKVTKKVTKKAQPKALFDKRHPPPPGTCPECGGDTYRLCEHREAPGTSAVAYAVAAGMTPSDAARELASRRCSVCGSDDELRPYGKGGALVCFACGMKDAETTKAEYSKRLEAAHAASPVVVLTEDGPTPVEERVVFTRDEWGHVRILGGHTTVKR